MNLANLSIFFSLSSLLLIVIFLVYYIQGPGKEYVIGKLPKFVIQASTVLRDTVVDSKFLFKTFPVNNLPVYSLAIKPEDYKKLLASIPDLAVRARQPGYLSGIDDLFLEENKQYTPAKFKADGKEYDVEVRFRGGGFPHWSYEQKSLRVRFEDTDLFNGQRQINLIIPLERGYMAEEFNNFRAKRLGLIIPDSKFVTMEINGSRPSLYWEVGHFTKEFLENNELIGDANLYSEDDFWQQQIYQDISYWRKFTFDPSKNENDFTEFNQLLVLLNDATDEEFYRGVFNILDKENFYAWSAHNLLAGSTHQDYSHNFRTYFDKSVGKLKIMPWDLMFYNNKETTLGVPLAIEASMNPLVQRILSNPAFMRARNEKLWQYLANEDNLKEELEFFDQTFASIQKAFYKDPLRSRSYNFFNNFVLKIRSAIEENFNNYRFLFTNAEVAYLLKNNLVDNNLSLEISHSNSLAPVYLDEVILTFKNDAKAVPFNVYIGKNLICSQDSDLQDISKSVLGAKCKRFDLFPSYESLDSMEGFWSSYAYRIFKIAKKKDNVTIIPKEKIDLSAIESIEVNLRNSYTDKKIKNVEGFLADNTEFTNFEDITKTSSEFVSAHPQFYLNSNKEVVLPAGTYVFNKNIIIPRDSKMIINSGVQINLVSNASLVSYSPVIAKGTTEAPIIVRGEADGVGENFAILDNDGLSELEYVQFSGGGESTVNGAFFSGMLAIHHAESIIKYSQFENAQGDDALNIKYASSTILHNTFSGNSADAIDYDFSDGVIERNLFVGNGNDSIDTSGSPVLVRYNDIRNSGDKCISIGEKSTIVVFNNILNGCNIGIEIKDSSSPVIINNVIINSKIAGINEYRKKPIFGGGQGKIYNTIIWDNKASIVLDSASTIEVNNSAVDGGYKGTGNIDKAPVFLAGFMNSEKGDKDFSIGGNSQALKDFLGIDVNNVPIGLLYGI